MRRKKQATLQEVIPQQQASDEVMAAFTLTEKDIIDIIADYDVLHRDQQPFFQPAYGVTTFDTNPPSVWIFNTGDHSTKCSTVIHEFIHVKSQRLGLKLSEEQVRQLEAQIYLQIFSSH